MALTTWTQPSMSPFWHGDDEQPGDSRANLLLTSERAVWYGLVMQEKLFYLWRQLTTLFLKWTPFWQRTKNKRVIIEQAALDHCEGSHLKKKRIKKDKKTIFAIFLSFIMGISAKRITIYYRECPEPNAAISFTSVSVMTIFTNNVSNSMILIMMYDYM